MLRMSENPAILNVSEDLILTASLLTRKSRE